MLRWAILGTGFISNTVIDAVAASETSQVELIAGRSADRVAAMQAAHSIPRGVVGYDEAIVDPDVDVVYIATPNHLHHVHAIAAAEAGKAILCEKSLTTTMEDAERLVGAVRGRVFFVEGLMYLAHPLHRRLGELLADAHVGELRSAHVRYAADIAHLANLDGGGTIYNLGCYPASLLQFVIQTSCGADVFADREMSALATRASNGTIGSTTASIRFGNGVLASLSSSDEYGIAHDCSIVTEQGELRFETNPWLPVAGDNVITWTPYDEEPQRVVVGSAHDAFGHQVAVVERSLAEGLTEAPRPSPRLDDSLEVMRFLTDWEHLSVESASPARN